MKNFKILSLIIASMFMLQSCSNSEDDIELTESATIESIEVSGNAHFFPGELISFRVVSNSGDDVSAESTIFVNGARVKGRFYRTPTATGTKFEVYAEINGLKSNVLEGTIYSTRGGGCSPLTD